MMTAFTDHSTTLLEEIDRLAPGRLAMTRGGYALVTRRERPEDLIRELYRGYGQASDRVRIRETGACDYVPPKRSPWTDAPDGVDVLLDRDLIRRTFPTWAPDVATVIHVRRAGSLSSQQLGAVMLETIRAAGGQLVRGEVKGIDSSDGFMLEVATAQGTRRIRANRLVNAAGPYLRDVGAMLGEDVPVKCVYQQKISFADELHSIPRGMPFTIDLDDQVLAWSAEDRELLAGNAATRYLTQPMKGGIHCRPDGPVDGTWIKLGWALNDASSDPHGEEPVDPHFPDTVLRGASRLHPALAGYIGRLPRGAHHYGGWYTMTEENWPLIGPMRTPGAFIAGALSGYGTMAACATGALTAAWVTGNPVPDYAKALTFDRFADAALMSELSGLGKGAL